LDGLLEGFCPEPRQEEQIALNSNGRLLLLQLANIDWLEATGNRVALHAGKETHLLDDSLSTVAAKLPPDRFLRVGPSALVNVAQIKEVRPLCQGEWRLVLRSGMRLMLGRA
jgi:two-component system LytT family response regulator